MFERFTEAARRALFFARYEASELGSPSIGTEHLLLGLTRQPTAKVTSLLGLGGKPLKGLRDELEAECRFREKISTSVEIPFSPDAKQALEFAADEANRMRHVHIGPEHMVLGVIRVEQSAAVKMLTRHDVRLDLARKEVERLSSGSRTASAAPPVTLDQIERIKQMVRGLADMPADSPVRFEVAQAIMVELDSLADGL